MSCLKNLLWVAEIHCVAMMYNVLRLMFTEVGSALLKLLRYLDAIIQTASVSLYMTLQACVAV